MVCTQRSEGEIAVAFVFDAQPCWAHLVLMRSSFAAHPGSSLARIFLLSVSTAAVTEIAVTKVVGSAVRCFSMETAQWV